VPLTAKFGYNLPLLWGLGVQADLSFGVFFSRTLYYQNALDMMAGKVQDEQVKSPLAGARLYVTYTFPFQWLKLYAGGGVDMVLETDGPIPPPVIEAGISIKPLALFRRKAKTEPAKTEPAETKLETTEIPQTPVTKAPQKIVLYRAAVYFWADSSALIEYYRPVLEGIGRRLLADPSLRLTLRGYTAPSGTEDGITALSAARSWYCAEYLMRNYGIAEERMNIEFYGADENPEPWELRRRVDLIIEQGEDL
jgi:outer membrane protein OmpA-like peptidoglycan-associated protein